MIGNIIAAIWGFSEATLFFFVPDIWISVLAVQSARQGLIGCIYALIGAMIGGSVMYYIGRGNLQLMNNLMIKIPAIRKKDILNVQSDLKNSGFIAVLFGPMRGIPYKIYASNAHSVMSITTFLLISIPARVIRFIIVALVISFVSETLLTDYSTTIKIQFLMIIWVGFYSLYFFIKRD